MLLSADMKGNDSDQKNTELFGSVPGTRSRLIEAAGVIFSEMGFDRATGRQICDLARVNYAAVNYHFGGKAQLYVEVLREAHRRLIDIKAIAATIVAPAAVATDPKIRSPHRRPVWSPVPGG